MADAPTREVLRYEHPGAGRRRARDTPKGRTVQPQAKHEIATLLGDRPRTREHLIEHLHLIQDTYHQLGAAHLPALADEMRLAYAEVALIGFRGGEASIGKRGWEALVREQKRA